MPSPSSGLGEIVRAERQRSGAEENSADAVKRAGHAEMPRYGWLPVTVPGAPAAWAACSDRFGRLPLTEVLAPAIRYAEEGFPLTPVLGKHWKQAVEVYRGLDGDLFAPWFDTFAPGGDAPEIGQRWRSPDHAKTLQAIAETRAEAFTGGNWRSGSTIFPASTAAFCARRTWPPTPRNG